MQELNTALACNDTNFVCALNQKPESVGDPKNIAKPAEKLALGMSSSYLGPKLLPTKSGYRYAGAPTGVSQITLPSPVARVDLKAPTIERLKLEATLGEQHRRALTSEIKTGGAVVDSLQSKVRELTSVSAPCSVWRECVHLTRVYLLASKARWRPVLLDLRPGAPPWRCRGSYSGARCNCFRNHCRDPPGSYSDRGGIRCPCC